MFSALKKLTLKQDVDKSPPGIAGSPMSGSLQKKFSRGVNYNMKIIIKGDRNVGKSCLFKRLQGGGFVESYTPTEEIQVASIQWSFKTTEDIVKVEVWDVVDKGKARPRNSGLKLSIAAGLPESPALDAEFLDVYKGTHGVILMMDVTKSWTFDYVTREISKIPPEIPILLLGNHCDMAHHRVVSVGQAQNIIENINEKRPSEAIYSESSMRNGFGLRLLHKFLGLPFLRLQREAYLSLMEQNKRDIEICDMELSEFLQSDDADYNCFLNKLSDKRRQIADSNSRVTNMHLSNSTSTTSFEKPIQPECGLRPTKSIIVGGGQPIVIGQKICEIPNTNQASVMVSNLLQNVELIKEQQSLNTKMNNMTVQSSSIISVEEFCPDEGTLDRSFLDDVPAGNTDMHHEAGQNDSDSDNDNNPMVARFNDEPESRYKNQLRCISKENLQLNHQVAKVNPLLNKNTADFSDSTLIFRKNSQSSDDLPTIATSYKSSYIDETKDCWMADQSVRRSPEGVEDSNSLTHITQSLEITTTDEKIIEKKSIHKKKKIKDKEKHERKEKKKKKRNSENVLEEFLNVTTEHDYHKEGSYEAI